MLAKKRKVVFSNYKYTVHAGSIRSETISDDFFKEKDNPRNVKDDNKVQNVASDFDALVAKNYVWAF